MDKGMRKIKYPATYFAFSTAGETSIPGHEASWKRMDADRSTTTQRLSFVVFFDAPFPALPCPVQAFSHQPFKLIHGRRCLAFRHSPVSEELFGATADGERWASTKWRTQGDLAQISLVSAVLHWPLALVTMNKVPSSPHPLKHKC